MMHAYNKLHGRIYELNFSVEYVMHNIYRRIVLDMKRLKHCGWISHLRSRPGLKPGFPNHEPCPNQVSADQVSNLVWAHYNISSLDMVWRN